MVVVAEVLPKRRGFVHDGRDNEEIRSESNDLDVVDGAAQFEGDAFLVVDAVWGRLVATDSLTFGANAVF
jgi:hypothetical protein